MLVLDARFTALAIFCGLATQWAAPIATVHAAVISRTPDDKDAFYHHPGVHSQRFLPWLGKGRPSRSKAVPEGGWKHKVRTNDFHPSNPFGRFIDRIISGIKRSHGHHKRSHRSILIPSSHRGVTYAVSHSRRADTPLWRVGGPVDEGDDEDDSDDIERREEDVRDGYVCIMSDTKQLACLTLTGGNTLNASEGQKTLVSLRPLPAGLVSGTSSEIPVAIEIHAPNADSKDLAVSNPLCATYDPNPEQPEPMTAMDCVDQTDPGRTAHGSQTFLYNADTQVIRPTWVDGQDDGKTDKPAVAQVADVPSSSSSSASPSVATSNSTSTSPASAIAPNATVAANNGTQASNGTQTNSTSALNPRAVVPAPVAQNVTLVFVPVAASAAAADVDSSATDAQNSTVASSEATTTMTRTVTVFAAETASSSFTASDSAAAASQSANTIGVELVSGSPAATIASSASSAQVLASASASASSAGTSFAAASVTAAPSSSINAAAVASSLAASAAASRSSAASAAALASASASGSASGTVAPEAISSTSASATSTADGSSSTFVAAVIEAAEPRMTGVSTAPYKWMFAVDK